MNEEKLARYEDAIRELEARQAELAKGRGGYARIFVGLVAVSLAGYFFGPWVGAATLFTGALMGFFGMYVVRVRASDYEHELRELQETVSELRRDDPSAPRER